MQNHDVVGMSTRVSKRARLTINAHTGCFISMCLRDNVNDQTRRLSARGEGRRLSSQSLTQFQPRGSDSIWEVERVKKKGNALESILK